MALVMVATLVFGRFFCSWGCHILALQDAAGWLMDKLHIKRQPIRSRTLIWVPIGVMLYLFIWPQILQLSQGDGSEAMHTVAAGGSRSVSYTHLDVYKRQVKRCVVDHYDHALVLHESERGAINADHPLFARTRFTPWQPTCEYLLLDMVTRIRAELPTGAYLSQVRLQETATSWAVWEDGE